MKKVIVREESRKVYNAEFQQWGIRQRGDGDIVASCAIVMDGKGFIHCASPWEIQFVEEWPEEKVTSKVIV